jgi:hypothetical protein
MLLTGAVLRCAVLPADAVLDKAGVWGSPVSAESPLLSAATLAKLSPAEAALAPQLAQVLLLTHSKRLKGGEQGGRSSVNDNDSGHTWFFCDKQQYTLPGDRENLGVGSKFSSFIHFRSCCVTLLSCLHLATHSQHIHLLLLLLDPSSPVAYPTPQVRVRQCVGCCRCACCTTAPRCGVLL